VRGPFLFGEGALGGARVLRPAESVVMARYNPFQFVQEVRQEVAKVTWPTRKEVWTTTVAVLIMVALASLFFLLADQAIGWLVSLVLGLGQ
jgi:preprotein translocase subunit SecE